VGAARETASVQIALTPDNRRDEDLPDLVTAAAGAGFSSLGISGSRADTHARSVYDGAGLGCHEIMALAITDDAERTLAHATRMAAAAEVMGAPWINTVFAAELSADSARLIGRCAAIFAEAGSGMAVEFSPLGTIPSIRSGLEVVDIAGPRAALMIDTWHFFFAGSAWEDLQTVPLEKIAYIQFDDGLEPLSEDLMAETMERRVLPGRGIFALERFAATLLERGFQGTVSVEVLSRELRQLPLREFLDQAYDATAAIWG
jgi:sugar phosphate isomerase/epimerase